MTVSARQDIDTTADDATITHAVTGADYGDAGVTAATVSVMVTDDDIASTAITLALSTTTVRESTSQTQITVTAELNGSAMANAAVVTLDLEGVSGGAEEVVDFAAIEPVTLTIRAGQTKATARVTVRPVRDDIDEGESEMLRLVADTASGLTLQPATSFELTLEDDDEAGIVLSRTTLTVREEGSRTWTVKLNSEPTDPVTVTLAAEGTDAQDLTIEPDQLTFATDNWNRTQTVTVSAAEDADGDDDTATIGHTATGGGYGSVEADLPVRVDDIDPASRSVQLSLAPDLVEEDGGAVTITVTAALDGAARSAETAVAVQATGGTAQAGTDFTDLGTVTVTIPAGETSGTQTFSFSPVDDSIDEGLSETVVLGGTFQGLTVRTATLTLADDDGRGIELPTGTVTLDEEGTATYAVSLATQPTGTGTVTVRVTVSGDRDITVAPTSMTFTGSNWDTAQMVTVTAARDDDAVTDTAELRHTASGADYGGVRALPLQVAVTDTSVRGVLISVATLEFREGGRGRYTVVLETKPTGTVTVRPSLAAGSDSDVTVSPSALSFTTSSWRTPKTVTVSARQDIDTTADDATITHAVTGADYGDAGVTAATVSVRVTDDDIASTAITLALSTTTVRESTSQTQITVTAELNGSAMANAAVVTLDLEGVSGGAEEVVDFAAITPVTLTIRAGQTKATARVTVRPVRDDIDEGESETLRLVADTASGLTLQPATSFELTLEDDDEAGIVLSRTTLTVREEGSRTWTVKLNSEPTDPVTVTLAAEGTDAQDLTIEPDQLTFATDNWNRTQTVTVSAAEDADGDDDTATIGHTATGGGYDSVEADLPVRVDDIDPASRSVQLSLAPDLVEEDGGAVTITVTAALDGAARSAETAVAVQATGGTAQAGTDFTDLGTVTVTIPAGETSGTQTFSFSPVDDSIDEGLSETVVLGGTFQGLTVRTATLTLADNDGRGIELPTGTVTLDEEGTATYAVSLATQPMGTGTVTVRVTVSGDRDISVAPTSMTFTGSNWDTAQMVTVTAARDDDAVTDTAELRHTASGADYGGVRALPLQVAVTDTSVRGVPISVATLEFREGGRGRYTVVLETKPTGTVTVRPSLAAGSDSDVTVSPSALSFTTSSWRTPKTVTVSARQDIDTTADDATITHAVTGADYGDAGVTAATVSVRVTDDDIASTAITLALSTTTVRESTSQTQITVTAELNGSAMANAAVVTLDLEGVSGGAEEVVDFAAIEPVTLTIRAGQTRATARVTVRPVRDDIDEGESEMLRLVADTASGLTLQPATSFELTLEDDDEAGIVLSRTTLTVREEGSRTWTVKLNSEPTDPVTVTLAAEGTDAQDLTIEPDQLTFATDNWNRTQTVTVSAAEDADGDDDTATIGHTATGGGYDSVEADLPVRVDDIDPASRSVQLSLAPDLVEEDGGSVTITVTAALDGAARSAETAVAVQATGGTAQAGTDFTDLGTVTVTIPAGETSGTQTFSFSPVDDSIDEGLSETVVLGGTFQGLTVRTATLTLADDDGRGIELPTGTVTLDEEGTATYAVSLATQPMGTGTVTVRVTVSGDRDITVTPTSMTFTGSNWDTAQMVTVTAARDDDAVTDTAELRHTASGADYGGVRALPLQVAVTDTSVRGVPISVATLEFREGGRGRYTVVLETKPTGTVTVRPSLAAGSDSDVTVSPSALSFTTSSWRTPKTVTVSARQDIDTTADDATITHAVTGADYGDAGVTAATVSVRVTDDDIASTAITLALSTTTVRESTSQTQITVTAELNGSAMANAAVVTLDLEGVSGGAEEVVDFAAIEPVTLTIRAGQTKATARVTVRPVRDDIDEGESETLRLVADTASGLTLQPATSFELTLEDDDEAGIVLSRTTLTVREEGSRTWTVKLNSEPTDPVTVTLAAEGTDAQDLTIEPDQLTFATDNWNRTQTVTVSAAEDADGDDDTATIGHTATGGGYDSVEADLPVRVDDIDPASRSVQLSLAPDLVEEDGGSVTITVTAALDGAARSAETAVAVQATGGTAQAGTDFTDLGTVTVTIPAGETSGTQTFSFSPVDDSIDEGLSETVVLGGTFQGLTVRTATLTLADNDGRGIELPTGTVTLDEEGTATYAVSLATQPMGTGTVTVRVTVSGDRDISVTPTSMTFTGSNWDTAQMVTVTAARDDDAVTDTAELRHTASGADYGGVRALPLQVAVTDTSVRGVPISVATLEFREGGRGRYTVVLETKPTGTVTVRPSLAAGSDSDVTVSPSALSFTTSSWRTPKTVTVSARQDIDTTADDATITHAVTGADYGDAGVTAATVSVRVTDDDIASTAITLALSTTTVRESTSQTQITVTAELNGSAMANAAVVTLDLEGVSGGAEEVVDFAAITPVTLTIRAGQTRATARVTVRPVRDDIDEGESEMLRLVANTASGLTLQPSSSFELTLEDDDEAGIVLSRTSLTVREEGSRTWTVKLNSEPTDPVTVTLAAEGTDAQDLTIEPDQLTFATDNWNRTQTVTVSAAEDADGDDDTATIGHTATGGGYDSVEADLPVRVDDIDQTSRSVQLSLAPDLVEEDGGSVTITVTAALDGAARSAETAVAVQATGGTAQAGTDFTDLGTVTVTIPAGETSGTQTFSFSPVDDSIDEGLSETVVLGGTFQGLTVRTATLTLADDDGRGIELPTGTVTLDEEGTATYAVSLATQPTGTGTVTVRVTVSGDRDITVAPTSMTFTGSNWDTAQMVTVTAARDDDAVTDTAELRHTASGADYGGVRALPLQVAVTDTSVRGVPISVATLEFREGGRGRYTVVLETKPTGTVTVRPSLAAGSDSDVTVSPSALSFTTSSWRTPKTVTVSARQDIDTTADDATITHAVTGADYGDAGVTAATVSVRVTDDDIASTAITLALSTTTVRESTSQTQITVTAELNGSAMANAAVVTLDLEGVSGGAEEVVDFAAITPVTLTIRAGQTRATARVTVRPVRDDIDEGDERDAAAGGEHGLRPHAAAVFTSFELTLEDDDEAGIVLSRTSLTVREEGSRTWTVKLNSEPTDPVTVTLAAEGTDAQDLTIQPDQLTFATDNWNRTQTVTVSAAEDADGDDDTATIGHTATGGGYDSVEADLPVRVDDIDQTSRSVQLSLAPDLVEENGGSVTITVTAALDGAARSAETAVAVQATGGTAQAGTDFTDLGTVTVAIPAGETSGTQTFSFSPVDDSIDEGLSETVVLGGTFQGLTVRTATLTLADDDGRGIELPTGTVTLRRGRHRDLRGVAGDPADGDGDGDGAGDGVGRPGYHGDADIDDLHGLELGYGADGDGDGGAGRRRGDGHGGVAPHGLWRGLWRGAGAAVAGGGDGHERARGADFRCDAGVPGGGPGSLYGGAGDEADGDGDGAALAGGGQRQRCDGVALGAQLHDFELENAEDGDGFGAPGHRHDR